MISNYYLAKKFIICNAKDVKKILHVLILLLIFTLFYSFSSSGQVFADKDGEVKKDGRCELRGKKSCEPGLDCAGFKDVPLTGGTISLGTCVEKAKEGENCLPKADCGPSECYGECESPLECKGEHTAFDNPGKCVVKGPPPPAPAPPCAVPNEKGPCPSVNTAFGILPTDAAGFIGKMFAVILASSGAIALILMMRAGYKIMMSQGKPETIQEGRDQLTSAIVGLMFIIFAFVFLELIGVDILRIPGFGGNSWLCGTRGVC